MSQGFRGETLKLGINDHMQGEGEGEKNREKESEKERKWRYTNLYGIRLKNQHAC